MFICKLKIFSQNINNLCWDNWQRNQRVQSFGFYFKLFISEDSLMNHFLIHPGERELWPGKEYLFLFCFTTQNSLMYAFCFALVFFAFFAVTKQKEFLSFPSMRKATYLSEKEKRRTGKHPSEKGRNNRKENNKTCQECLWYCPSISGKQALKTEKAEEKSHKTKGTISLVIVLISVPLVLKDLGHRE